METGFHVDTPSFEFGIRLRIGAGPLGLFSSLRAGWRWLRSTLGVRLGFQPPPLPHIGHARVESLDEGFAAFRELRGALRAARILEGTGLGRRVSVEHGGAVHVALHQADAGAALHVDGGVEVHTGSLSDGATAWAAAPSERGSAFSALV